MTRHKARISACRRWNLAVLQLLILLAGCGKGHCLTPGRSGDVTVNVINDVNYSGSSLRMRMTSRDGVRDIDWLPGEGFNMGVTAKRSGR